MKFINKQTRDGNKVFVLMPEEAYEELISTQNSILNHVSGGMQSKPGIGDYIPKEEAKRITSKSDTTLWHLRRTGTIKAAKMGAEVFYSRQSILDYLNKNLK